MCGIAGFIAAPNRSLGEIEAIAKRMALAIQHRGPDDGGVWSDAQVGIALTHRRLSILDLSSAGHQPMVSASGRYVMVFNGEIYNHLEIRGELEGAALSPPPVGGEGRSPEGPGNNPVIHWATGVSSACRGAEYGWRGHSDTETLLAAFDRWGMEAALTKAVGMFAIALWDVRERTLHLARDRFGEKPLYYGWVGGGAERAFVFGSELKALRVFPGFDNPVCQHALAQYLCFSYVPAPRSIYHGIYKLEPGCVLTVRGVPPAAPPAQPLRSPASYEHLRLRRWWALADVVQAGAQSPVTDETEALQALEDRLSDAVRLQSLADVPLGAFLSGGVDSSTIVALMQQQASRPVKTFTIGFEEAGFDESAHAQAVAQHLGTDHAQLFVTAAEARAVIPQLPTMYDEPFADSSQIPTYLVCRAARQRVTVALSGDAGDELFGGYNRYFWGPHIWRRLAWLPYPLRQALGAGAQTVAPATWDGMLGWTGVVRPGEKMHKLARVLRAARSMDGLYKNLVSECPSPLLVRIEAGTTPLGPPSLLAEPLPGVGVQDSRLRMMYRDSLTYLPDDILCKVDRAAMAVSLETRVPFLDHRVVELAWRLPLSMKIRGPVGKWALRQVLYRHVPRELIERPKAGFAIPVGQWLRGPLRDWAESLLSEGRMVQEGHLNPAPIAMIWRQHLSGRHDWTPKLWSVLMFQAWLESQ